MSDVAAEVRNLQMLYGAKEVLSGVEFSLRTGEVVAMLGPNGAGKTTTIEILEGFRMRSAGEVTVLGQDPARAGEAWRARIGVVLQSWRDHAKWRVRELLRHLGMYYARYGTPEIDRPWDTDELLDLVGLTASARTPYKRLSGGQQQRLCIARTLALRPEVILFDEPTAALDPISTLRVEETLQSLREHYCIAIVTHNLQQAARVSNVTAFMYLGELVEIGPTEQMFTAPKNRRTDDYVTGRFG